VKKKGRKKKLKYYGIVTIIKVVLIIYRKGQRGNVVGKRRGDDKSDTWQKN